jgi:hypothetical protein
MEREKEEKVVENEEKAVGERNRGKRKRVNSYNNKKQARLFSY